jgi:hypothetical protein
MKNWLMTCAALPALSVPFVASGANAAPIAYSFAGTGSGTLDGTAFDGFFHIDMVSDTSNVTSGGGEFRNDVGSMTFFSSGAADTISAPLVLVNTAAPGFAGFGQEIAPFPTEALTDTVFETYNLITALPFTTGGISVAPATFVTAGGDLVFDDIETLGFTAESGRIPEPSTWAMMALGFASFGFLAYRNRRTPAA